MGEASWSEVLATLLSHTALSTADADWAMREIMAGEASAAQLAAFAVLLRAKGETPQEMAGLVSAMLAHAPTVTLESECADIVGTGGDGANTVNISTMAALVAASGGVPVVKHGNRAASSKSGSADVLEALGVRLDLGPEAVAQCVHTAGIGFCFAARFHSGMRHAAAARRQLGVPTAFNFLGPLSNPAQPRAGAIGCADSRMAPVMARVLADRGASALVMRGEDGLDEMSIGAPTRVWLAHDGRVTETQVDALELGVARAPVSALRGGDAVVNANVARELLAGKPGPIREAVTLNAAAAFAAFEGLHADIATDLPAAVARGLERANEALDSQATAETLRQWVSTANAAS